MKIGFTEKPKTKNSLPPKPLPIPETRGTEVRKSVDLRGNARFRATCPFCGIGQVFQVTGHSCAFCYAVVTKVEPEGGPHGWPQAYLMLAHKKRVILRPRKPPKQLETKAQ